MFTPQMKVAVRTLALLRQGSATARERGWSEETLRITHGIDADTLAALQLKGVVECALAGGRRWFRFTDLAVDIIDSVRA